jgi:2-(1,2-epoxy-1,2-dihydrophenyl)acetyl-CoA isomerase
MSCPYAATGGDLITPTGRTRSTRSTARSRGAGRRPRRAADDPGVRAVALTGSGRAFCVGQDLRELEDGYREGRAADFAAELERYYAPI